MLRSEAGTLAYHFSGRDGAASAAGRTPAEAAAASDSADSGVILVGVSLARDNLKVGTAATTPGHARDCGQQDASQLRHQDQGDYRSGDQGEGPWPGRLWWPAPGRQTSLFVVPLFFWRANGGT